MTGLSDDGTDRIWHEALDWLLRVRAEPGQEALRAGLAAWLSQDTRHVDAYARAERVWRLTGALPMYDAVAAGSVPSSTPPQPIPFPPRGSRRGVVGRVVFGLTGAAIAASLLAVLAPGLMIRLRADHRTGVAERRDVTLEDGTLVSLNAGSAIALSYDDTKRQVTVLSGDAFFQVAPDRHRPFSVKAEDMTIVDIGTAFVVDVGAETVSVAVESGAVQVSGVDRIDARLDPGGRLSVDRATGLVHQDRIPTAQIAPWRSGQLLVDNVPISQLVERLRAYFPGYIVVRDHDLAANRVSGVFNLGDPASALRAALKPYGGAVASMTPYILIVEGRP